MKEIKLSQGKSALVDDEDYEELNKYKWCAYKDGNTYYAIKTFKVVEGYKVIKMHKIIANTPKGMYTDHIDGNGLNNQKSNLRIVTNRQNQQNRHDNRSSKYIGVSWNKDSKKWRARIMIDKKTKFLGYFNNELDAYNAYLKKLKEIGEVFIDDI